MDLLDGSVEFLVLLTSAYVYGSDSPLMKVTHDVCLNRNVQPEVLERFWSGRSLQGQIKYSHISPARCHLFWVWCLTALLIVGFRQPHPYVIIWSIRTTYTQ